MDFTLRVSLWGWQEQGSGWKNPQKISIRHQGMPCLLEPTQRLALTMGSSLISWERATETCEQNSQWENVDIPTLTFYRHVSFLWLKQVTAAHLSAENLDTYRALSERGGPREGGELSTSLPWTSGKPQALRCHIRWPHLSSPSVALADVDSELDMRVLQRDHVIFSKLSSSREYAGDTWAREADACIGPHVRCHSPGLQSRGCCSNTVPLRFYHLQRPSLKCPANDKP